MASDDEIKTIYDVEPVFYYPFTKPIDGTLSELCNNPTKYGCTQPTKNGDEISCNAGSKPVLDCDADVCCPEIMFPYTKLTNYCTYIKNQGCFTHQVYAESYYDPDNLPCPSDTYSIKDCDVCCPKNISNNMNFTDVPYNPLDGNVVGTLWNETNAQLEDGIYKITVGDSNLCMIAFDGSATEPSQSPPKPYIKAITEDCGGTWLLTKIYDRYIGSGIYPSKDLKYTPGGYTIYNEYLKKYISANNSVYGSAIDVILTDVPHVVNIFKNTNGSYRIQNPRNQIGSFSMVENIGNPSACLVVDGENIQSKNWGGGQSGKPCGIGGGPDSGDYKFNFEKIETGGEERTVATLQNGMYYIVVNSSGSGGSGGSDDKCVEYNGSITKYGGSVGLCGTISPRFALDTPYKWKLTNEDVGESGSGLFSLQNVVNGNYLTVPSVDQPQTIVSQTKSLVHIYVNNDGSFRIVSSDSPSCLVVDGGVAKGFNWNIGNDECGTFGNAINGTGSYKLSIIPVPPVVIPPVSNLPNGDGFYEIRFNYRTETGTGTGTESFVFEQVTGGDYKVKDPSCVNELTCYGTSVPLPNILKMTPQYAINSESEKWWKITKTIDNFGSSGYTIQNVASKQYMYVSKDPNTVLATTATKTVVYIYTNGNGSYTIQNREGFCLNKTALEYGHHLWNKLWNYNFNGYRWLVSDKACGLSTPTDDVSYFFKYVNTEPTLKELTGNGGNCNYNWYTSPTEFENISGFSDEASCNASIEESKQNSTIMKINTSLVNGTWTPFFSDDTHILRTYKGRCIVAATNGDVTSSTTCSGDNAKWTFSPEYNDGLKTGKYYVINSLTGGYLDVPAVPSKNGLKTTNVPTAVGVVLTYPTFGEQLAGSKKLKPTSYYFHFTNGNQTCAYGGSNSVVQTIKWGNSTGLVTPVPAPTTEVPKWQQQQQTMYECGVNPLDITSKDINYDSPNLNYRFTVDNYCLYDIRRLQLGPLVGDVCFNDYGILK